eukprot:TRINITY_DN73_c0_g1_i2.p1 TRINITY_DN73_c0_g1~~TRINITY_DN73_c0_g1_i2.p1  ORF type:complete len:722 (-),score=332.75 TRINITY_DN73_c0_g1_i2:161-2326(-)
MRRVVALVAAAAVAVSATDSAAWLSPITRVVELLQGLSEKIEKEGKEEETLYKKFVCWGKTTVDTKTASNVAAEARISELQTYVADIEAGRIEFTTERVDLEKEVAQLSADIETATALREQEKSDYEDAKAEMDKGVAALEEAITVLSDATGDKKAAGLLSVKRQANEGFAARSEQVELLVQAVQLGDRLLSKGDALFLHRLLMGGLQPIEKDWKKLNRKATFKMGYKARSGEIQSTLAKLLDTFKSNLEEATKKEEDAQALFDKLMAAKGEQKTKAEDSLLSLEKEMGVRGMTVEQSKAEIEDLQQQVTDDTKYIEDTNTALADKDKEWTARQELRANEVKAISEAISILHSDDSRDLFKKSLSSQGYFFLQTQMRTGRKYVEAASVLLRKAAGKSHDSRLLALVRMAQSTGSIAEVITAIDDMVATLKEEETTDLTNKEKCESDRATDTKQASVTSRDIDELTDSKDRLEGEVHELATEIEGKNKEIEKINEDLDKAKTNREAEAAAFGANKADDEAAISLVEQAHTVLQNFYSSNNLMLAAKRAQTKTKQVPAGEAPPPPPSTWNTAEYGGKTESAQGILSILTVIKEDIQKDLDKATAGEDAAVAAYDELKSDLETQITDLQTAITDLDTAKADKEGEIQTAVEDRTTKKGELTALLDKIKAAEPGCDFIAVNFDVRTQNRQTEIDGLTKAKAILQGADFSLVQAKPKSVLAVRRHH